jgi:hypothetical protein
MKKLILLLAAGGLLGGSAYLAQHYDLEGLKRFELRPRSASLRSAGDFEVDRVAGAVRVAVYRLAPWDDTQADDPQLIGLLAEVVARFDVTVLSGLHSAEHLLTRLTARLNSLGRSYEFAAGPLVGSGGQRQQFAFVFDAESLQLDRTRLYTVRDPDNLLECDPLVGWFRARGAEPSAAFTFSLVAASVSPLRPAAELVALEQTLRAVRDDGRGEDDVLLALNLPTDRADLGPLERLPQGIVAPSGGRATGLHGNQRLDVLVFQTSPTLEYFGHSGVLDVVRTFNLTTAQVERLSPRLPVWADFTSVEAVAR